MKVSWENGHMKKSFLAHIEHDSGRRDECFFGKWTHHKSQNHIPIASDKPLERECKQDHG
jgi:hypothetical protein